jgi:ribosomal protein S18 acetylase RimI-like enzyme
VAIEITAASSATPELADALARLLPQLTQSSQPPTLDELRALVESETSTLLVATDESGEIVGTLTLAIFRIPTGVRAWIEDVVVDESARGQGLAEQLTRHALELARGGGAASVELTSRPSRETANRLYERLGFVRRETNVYRFALK